MRWMIWVVWMTACDGGTLYEPDVVLPDAFVTCETVSDCVVVQLGCCDHCNGGQGVAVRDDRAAEVIADYSEDCGGGVDCTLLGCGALEPECRAGECVAIQQPLER